VSGTHMKAVYRRTRVAGAEDVAVTTHDFWKDSGDSTDAECDTIATHFMTFWDTCCQTAGFAMISNNVELYELRFYRGYDGDGSPGAVDYVKTYAGRDGEAPGSMTPPQVACTVTEITDSRRHWGRFYIPGISADSSVLADDGTLLTTKVTQVATVAETMYEAWGAMANHTPVVWGRRTASIEYAAVAPPRWRPSWYPSSSVAVGEPTAFSVQAIRVDEILDIQRRRRWEATQTRVTRQLA
jgi:hypothetical protein